MTKKGSTILLLACVSGIYASFLTWSYLQEKLSSKNYSLDPTKPPEFFKAPFIINIVQSFFGIIIGSIYLSIKTPSNERTLNPLSFLFKKDNRKIFYNLYLISISQSLSSPLSYMSLQHVDYILFLLAKSCKLIPVMLIHFLLFKTIYAPYKYLIAALITIGVTIFTLSSSSAKSSGSNDGSTYLGLFQLVFSLFLDGFTNSSQDNLFKASNVFKITGAHLMSSLNFLTFLNLSFYTIIFTDQTAYFLNFLNNNGFSILKDILLFSICGALGQIFIFITLEKFNSIVLVTVTVTRKMLSMCLSVVLFGHVLNIKQWLGLIFVFGGIGFESFVKIFRNDNPKKKLN